MRRTATRLTLSGSLLVLLIVVAAQQPAEASVRTAGDSEGSVTHCATQVRSVGSLGIDWGTTCTVSRSSWQISRLTLGNQRWINRIPWVPVFGQHCGVEDGWFGGNTEQCVRSFQRGIAGLTETGTINSNTWRALEDQRHLIGCFHGVCDYRPSSTGAAVAQRRDSYGG